MATTYESIMKYLKDLREQWKNPKGGNLILFIECLIGSALITLIYILFS